LLGLLTIKVVGPIHCKVHSQYIQYSRWDKTIVTKQLKK